jgi:hypothetical protein
MTPLAAMIAEQNTLSMGRRTIDYHGLSVAILDAVGFDISAMVDQVTDFALDQSIETNLASTSQLPFEQTWIEFRSTDKFNEAFLDGSNHPNVDALRREDVIRGLFIKRASDDKFICKSAVYFKRFSSLRIGSPLIEIDHSADQSDFYLRFILLSLGIINTPKIANRLQHMPNRHLERRLAKALGVQGRYPLKAWSTVTIDAGPSRDMTGEPSAEAHYTGKKAYHPCRGHFRVRCGQIEWVKAHWRGDPSLGIKQTRYSVKPISGPVAAPAF